MQQLTQKERRNNDQLLYVVKCVIKALSNTTKFFLSIVFF